MENEPEVIQQQMQDTRTALTEKLETLEAKVVGTVEGATTAVTETVENVKQAVQDTVENVKETMQDAAQSMKQAFDIGAYVDEHPWLMVGGAFAVGCVGGYLLGGSEPRGATPLYPPPGSPWPATRGSNGYGQPYQRADLAALKEPAAQESERAEPGWLDQLGDTFGAELKKLKGLAIGTSLGLLRDMIARSVPDNLGPQLTKLVDDVTTKVGGEPVRGPVLREDSPAPRGRESLHV